MTVVNEPISVPRIIAAKTNSQRSTVSFEKHFTQSIEFRSQFDTNFAVDINTSQLLETSFRQTRKKAMQEPFFSTRQQLCALAKDYVKDNTIAPFSYQCLADCHVFLRACLDQKVITEKYMTLTVGDVSFKGKKLFNTTRQTMETAVAHSITTQDDPQFHVWLTLVDMTVIDLTLIDQLVRSGHTNKPENSGRTVNIWRPDNKGDFNYHPVLVDDDFLSRLQQTVH